MAKRKQKAEGPLSIVSNPDKENIEKGLMTCFCCDEKQPRGFVPCGFPARLGICSECSIDLYHGTQKYVKGSCFSCNAEKVKVVKLNMDAYTGICEACIEKAYSVLHPEDYENGKTTYEWDDAGCCINPTESVIYDSDEQQVTIKYAKYKGLWFFSTTIASDKKQWLGSAYGVYGFKQNCRPGHNTLQDALKDAIREITLDWIDELNEAAKVAITKYAATLFDFAELYSLRLSNLILPGLYECTEPYINEMGYKFKKGDSSLKIIEYIATEDYCICQYGDNKQNCHILGETIRNNWRWYVQNIPVTDEQAKHERESMLKALGEEEAKQPTVPAVEPKTTTPAEVEATLTPAAMPATNPDYSSVWNVDLSGLFTDENSPINPLTGTELPQLVQPETATRSVQQDLASVAMVVPRSIEYPGNKHSAGVYQRIINQITPHDVFVSGCLGTCAVLSHKRPASSNFGIDVSLENVQHYWDGLQRSDIKLVREDIFKWLSQFTFSNATPDRWFFYFDPPYILSSRRNGKLYYDKEWTDEQHMQLIDWCVNLTMLCWSANIAISHYPCKLYDLLVNEHGWRKITYQVSTHQGTVDECLYMNYPEPTELHEYTFLSEDKIKRQALKRKKQGFVQKFKRMKPIERNAILDELRVQFNLSTPPLFK